MKDVVTICVLFPPELLSRATAESKKLGISRACLMRTALEEKVLEQELRQGYLALERQRSQS